MLTPPVPLATGAAGQGRTGQSMHFLREGVRPALLAGGLETSGRNIPSTVGVVGQEGWGRVMTD